MAEKKAVKKANKNKRKTAMRYRLERRVRRSSCGPGRVGRVSIGRATGRRSACTAAARPPCTAADSSTPRSPARPNSCPKKKTKEKRLRNQRVRLLWPTVAGCIEMQRRVAYLWKKKNTLISVSDGYWLSLIGQSNSDDNNKEMASKDLKIGHRVAIGHRLLAIAYWLSLIGCCKPWITRDQRFAEIVQENDIKAGNGGNGTVFFF